MSRPKSDILKAFGTAFEFFKAIVDEVLFLGGNDESIRRVLSDKNLRRQIAGLIAGSAKNITKSILTFLLVETISAQSAVTTSEKYFRDVGVKWTNDTFKKQFLGLEVSATDKVELAVNELTQASLDAPILSELGDKAETAVPTFRAFLWANRGGLGWFIFYLRGKNGNLWAVDAYWNAKAGRWHVDASSVMSPNRWGAGRQVVSRN